MQRLFRVTIITVCAGGVALLVNPIEGQLNTPDPKLGLIALYTTLTLLLALVALRLFIDELTVLLQQSSTRDVSEQPSGNKAIQKPGELKKEYTASPVSLDEPHQKLSMSVLSGGIIGRLRIMLKRLRQSGFLDVFLIPFAILTAKLTQIILGLFNINFVSPPDAKGFWFISEFIGWFGIFYAILMASILIRVWEQLDNIDREFDLEADSVMILYEDTLFLKRNYAELKQKIDRLVRQYVEHVMRYYPFEMKGLDRESFLLGQTVDRSANSDEIDPRQKGDNILKEIRGELHGLTETEIEWTRQDQFLIPELINRLNQMVEIRGDRIAIVSQRLFNTLRFVALFTSIVFIVPFYFVSFSLSSGLLDNLLVLGVTAVVIFLYLIIEDFDDPFTGTWKITTYSWQNILREMDSDKQEPATDDSGTKGSSPKKPKTGRPKSK